MPAYFQTVVTTGFDTTASTTRYMNPHAGRGATTEAQHTIHPISGCTLAKLQMYAASLTVSTGNTTGRSRNNNANGNQLVTISAATVLYEDTTNTDAVTAGNVWATSLTNGMNDSCNIGKLSMQTTFTGNTPILGAGYVEAIATSTSRYGSFGRGPGGLSTTESNYQITTRRNVTYSRFRMRTETYSGTSSTCRFRKNTANGNQSVAVTATGNVEDTTNTDAVTTTTPDVYAILFINSSTMNTMTYIGYTLQGDRPYVHNGGWTSDIWTFRANGLGSNEITGNSPVIRAALTGQNMFVECISYVSNKTYADSGNLTTTATTTGDFEDTTNTSAYAPGSTITDSVTNNSTTFGATSIEYNTDLLYVLIGLPFGQAGQKQYNQLLAL